MRHSLSIFYALLLIVGLTGCRSKKELELFRPGDTEVWRKLESKALRESASNRPRVELETSMGTIILELFQEEAPISVENFLKYVNDGFYDGTIFHRVQPGMVVQGGGFEPGMVTRNPTYPTIKNEATNGLRNLRGTLGAARKNDMDSASSQFYINLTDNVGFNGDGITSGYAVFGRVYDGMDVVDSMALVDTDKVGGYADVPVEAITIISARQVQ